MSELQQGEFIWLGDAARSGPLLLVVSLDEQLAYVYRNGVLTGVSTASTGKRGYETPTGVFTIPAEERGSLLEHLRRRAHALHAAPDVGGIALHAGGLARLSGLARLYPAAE